MNQGMMKGQVNAGCLLFMPEDYPDQRQQDCVDALLYTQLAATKKHSRFDEEARWRQTWIAALTRFAGVLRHHESVSVPCAELESLTLWKWVERYLPTFIPRDLFGDIEDVAQRSFSLQPHQPAIGLLARQSAQIPDAPSAAGRKIGLQLALHHPSTGLCLIAVSFETHQPVEDELLSAVLNREDVVGNLELAFYAIDTIELLYTQFRRHIAQALVDRRGTLLSPLWEADDVQSS